MLRSTTYRVVNGSGAMLDRGEPHRCCTQARRQHCGARRVVDTVHVILRRRGLAPPISLVLATWASDYNAALIMIVVFIAFGVTGPIPPTELGITLALAVLLDATVIRMMLVPALLGMLGERAWGLPGWLDLRLPRIDFSH